MEDEYRLRQLKTIQNLNTVAFIAGPVSLLFGGLLLSIISIVCAIVAFIMIGRIISSGSNGEVEMTLRRQSIIALVITGIALVINGIWFGMAFSVVMQAMQTGDFSQVFDALGMSSESQDAGSASSSGSSVWD